MRYLPNGAQMKAADTYTIEKVGIPSLVLMERAALETVRVLKDRGVDFSDTLVVCGSGNNGGDGFAIARLLFLDQVPVSIWFVGKEQSCTDQTRHQKEICEKYGITFCSNPEINEYTVIVDGIFGVGLSREITGNYKEIIDDIVAMDLKAIKIHPDYQNTFFDDEKYLRLIDYAVTETRV